MPLKYVYRMVHIQNIAYISKVGIVHRDSEKADPNYVNLGDISVINRRKQIKLGNGRYISDYIPFYFGMRTPMLYVIQNGFNGVKKVSPEDIVYIVVKIQDLIDNKVKCVFTDGHAIEKSSNLYNAEYLSEIDNIISEADVKAQYWSGVEDTDLKRRKEAELLVEEDLEPSLICGYVVYNDDAKNILIGQGIAANKIEVRSNYYF